MDFYQIKTRELEKGPRKGEMEVYPDFTVGRSKDLMVRGRSFYAVWDEEAGLWSTDEYDVQRLVDAEMERFAQERFKGVDGAAYSIKYLRNFSSNGWSQFRKYMQNVSDSYHTLDSNLTFANTEVKKSDYVSRRLPYRLESGDISAWDELVGTLYSVEERAKIEWAIGAIVSGDSKKIQKFLVLYGPAGTGKSTILNIVEALFVGYTTTFEAKALGSYNGTFATEVFKGNPLVAIQHDGDLSKIEDNTKLNSIVSHEDMTMNEKHKPSYTAKVNAFLLMGTNQPVKISDAKSGIIRRLIDVHPTGVKIPSTHYSTLMSKIDFELGAIAHHCLEVYRSMGKNYYNTYRPLEMMLQTDVFFNFIEASFDIFKEQDGTTLKQAYMLYKEFCSDTGIDRVLPQYKVREELRNYFEEFHERKIIDGVTVRSAYSGFNANKFKAQSKNDITFSLVIEETTSLLDDILADAPAVEAVYDETIEGYRPKYKWKNVRTILRDVDTSELHYVKVPPKHIVIDFDLADENGAKSLERNLQAASVWPPTYAELSKSGDGVHLHYYYEGDVSELAAHYSEGIEVKTLLGDSSLRRRFSKGNNIPIATFNGSLPKKEKKVLTDQKIKSEKGLRDLIARNLKKEFHPGTKSSVDFIKKILDDAYESGMQYDLTDMRSKILGFAARSTNQSLVAVKTVQQMKFKSDHDEAFGDDPVVPDPPKDDRRVHYDLEVYPNLLVICWKYEDAPEDSIVRMINPTAAEVEEFARLKLVGFNNRRYDNHIVYGAIMGFNNAQLYQLSQKLINNDRTATFGEAYNLSHIDIYEMASVKQSLKRFQIELGLKHQEMDLSWDDDVPEELWDVVVDYCCNDVISSEAVFKHQYQDYVARLILAELSGLNVNDTTQRHTAKILFGNDRQPQKSFVYTDLSTEFPGYNFDPMRKPNKSEYRGEDPSEGGYVYAEPGIYENVVVLDVASMHPNSLIQLNAFGDEYTKNFKDLVEARVAIKRKEFDRARTMLDGRLAPYLTDEENASKLAYALKIVINIVYGMTSAKFDNPFRDPRNVDNIVAKRGALFMIDLKHYVQEELGLQVVHIKTDSIKVVNPTDDQISAIMKFGLKYGYEFEHESTYDKFALVNDAVYIAREGGKWTATGAQFQHPYVFKTLFSGEELTFDDYCEIKQVSKGTMYLDFEHDRAAAIGSDGMQFVGRIGKFIPVTQNGAVLYRVAEDGDGNPKNYAVTGTKGYLWLESSQFNEDDGSSIDMSYFEKLADEAVNTINKFGLFEEFIS